MSGRTPWLAAAAVRSWPLVILAALAVLSIGPEEGALRGAAANTCTAANCTAGFYFANCSAQCVQCPPGYYCEGNSSAPQACPAGNVSSAGATSLGQCTGCNATAHEYARSGDATCRTCPAGFACPSPSSEPVACDVAGQFARAGEGECQACPAGYACASAAAEPIPCGAGSYSTGGNVTACTPCPAGRQCTLTTAAPVECGAGWFSPGNTTNCTRCALGYQCPGSTSSTQTACAAGYTSNPNRDNCIVCPAGFTCADPTQEPQACPAGTYARNTSTTCEPCPSGHACASASAEPVACTAGTFSTGGNVTACSPCAAGFFTANVAASTCTACAAGTYSRQGAVNCTACPAGSSCATPSAEPEPCAVGTYSLVGEAYCAACPAGSACPARDLAPVMCPAGTYTGVNATACVTCPAGSRCPSNSSTPLACPAGTYATEGSASCTACPAGFQCPSTSLAPVPCSPGEYAGANATSCTACPAGFQCASPELAPQACVAGTFAGARATNCTACPAGSQCPSTSQPSAQQACSPGTYSSGAQASCTECPAGSRCPTTTAAIVIACDAGTFSNANSPNCTQCPNGEQCPSTDGQNRAVCADGYYSLGGATVCTLCPAGHTCPNKATQPQACTPGSFALGGAFGASCTPCPAGQACPDTTTNATQTACQPGTYSTGGQVACTVCPPGSACPSTTVATVTACADGSYSLGGVTACTQCVAGEACVDKTAAPRLCQPGEYQANVGQTVCNQCPAGSECPTTTAEPVQCGPGNYSAASSTRCLPCTPGFLCGAGSTTPAAGVCPAGGYCNPPDRHTACPPGTYNNVTGAASINDCIVCPAGYVCGRNHSDPTAAVCPAGFYCPAGTAEALACPAGTFNPAAGATNATACLVCTAGSFCGAAATEATQCGPGVYCPAGTSFANVSQCPEGTFSAASGATDVGQCTACSAGRYCPRGSVVEQRCPPGTFSPDTGLHALGQCRPCTAGRACPDFGLTNASEACAAGHFCPEGTVLPTARPCPAGTYTLMTNLTSEDQCSTCPAGKACPLGTGGPSQLQILDCAPGHYCPAGTEWTTQYDCPEGTFTSATNLTAAGECTECPAGRACPGGESVTQECAAGHFCPARSVQPTDNPCPAGTYSSATNLTAAGDCTDCPVGHYCPVGATYARGCPPGTYTNQTNTQGSGPGAFPECQPCPGGSRCALATADPVACGLGNYSADGEFACTPCARGHYCDNATTSEDDMRTNKQCAGGLYCDQGRTAAPSAPSDSCIAGHYCPSATAFPVPCDAGTLRTTTGAATQGDCSSCPAGSYCVYGAHATSGSCSAGYFCPANSTTPTQEACAGGSFRATPGATAQGDCAECSAGKYCPLASTSETDCPVGHYCPVNSSAPTRCPTGTYGNRTNLTAVSECTACDPGYFCDLPGLVAPVGQCASGYYCPLNATAAKPTAVATSGGAPCPAGFYCPLGSFTPTPCPAGTYRGATHGEAQGDCYACPGGSYCAGENNTAPTGACAAGYYCTGSAMNATQFAAPAGAATQSGASNYSLCEPGQYTGASAQSACAPCPAGFVCASVGVSMPAECPQGFYCANGTHTPVPCPSGTYGNRTKLTQESECTVCDPGQHCTPNGLARPVGPCDAGYYCINGSRLQDPVRQTFGDRCPTGHYCPAGSHEPTPCPVGTFLATEGNTALGDCVACTGGAFCNATGLSAPAGACAAGYYCTVGARSAEPAPNATGTNCSSEIGGPCPVGHYCPEGTTTPLPCPGGNYTNVTNSVQCLACPARFFCPEGAVQPSPCPEGRFCPVGTSNTTIQACPVGTYSNVTQLSAASECIACDGGQYCDETGMGAPAGACDAGYYCTSGASTAQGGNGSNGDVAVGGACPAGHYCPAGSVEPTACTPGTYNPANTSTNVTACLACAPGRFCNSSGLAAPTGLCEGGFVCVGGAHVSTPVDGTTGFVCPAGHYCPSGSAVALGCPAGEYNNVTGQSACVTCPAGFYCLENATEFSSRPCPLGHYCPAGTNASTQFPCPAGTSGNTTGLQKLEDCVDCPLGRYCPLPGEATDAGNCTGGFYCSGRATSPSPADGANGGACKKGTFCPAGSGGPQPCTPGSYCDADNLTAPTGLCYAGYFCAESAQGPTPDGSNATIGGPCPAGFYCVNGTSVPEACPLGTFGNSSRLQALSQCTQCTPGQYCASTNLTAPTGACAGGYFCPGGQSASQPDESLRCTSGQFCPVGSAAPQPCPAGQYQDQSGQASCLPCPAGFYCSFVNGTNGTATPQTCPAGYYCPTGTNSSTQFACPAGTFNALVGTTNATACVACTPGKFCASTGLAAPTGNCSAGHFCRGGSAVAAPTTGSDAGGQCQPWTYCPEGSTNETHCPPGFFTESGGQNALEDCLPCPAGNYCVIVNFTGGESFTPVQAACSAGYACVNASSTPTPTDGVTGFVCAAGAYCPAGSGSPISCTNGTYNPSMQQGACLACPDGFECTQHGMTNRTECRLGHYCPANTGMIPPACPTGTYGNETGLANVTGCRSCDGGHFCNGPGLAAPTALCDGGYVCGGGSTTGTPSGVWASAGDNGACPLGHYCVNGSSSPVACNAGSYLNTTGADESSDCVTCPAGSFCAAAGLAVPSGSCAPGYYCEAGSVRANQTACPPGHRCPAGSGAPQGCAPGEYQPAAANETCIQCPAGRYCPQNATQALVCPQGSYCVAGVGAPQLCPNGTYGNGTGLTRESACQTCPGGVYCANGNITGACSAGFYCAAGAGVAQPSNATTDPDVGGPCPANHYCPEMTTVPLACSNHTYRESGLAVNASSCDVVPPGYYVPGDGQPRQLCATGAYCPGGSPPLLCDRGTYNNVTGASNASACVACPAGYACPQRGTGEFTAGVCAVGVFCTNSSDEQGGLCKTGHYCPEGTATPVACAAGTFRDTRGAAAAGDCALCPSGSLCNVTGVVTAEPCPAGQFCPEGSNGTQPCPGGSYCPAGSTAPIPCPNSTYCPINTANPLVCTDDGTYCPENTTVPIPCPAGFYCPVVSGSQQVVAAPVTCPAAFYCPSGAGTPTACPLGAFCPEGSAAPQSCSRGYFSPDETPQGNRTSHALACSPCAAGQWSNGNFTRACSACDAGFLCTGAAQFPDPANSTVGGAPCAIGSYCLAGATSATPCPAGTYGASSGLPSAAACTRCPAGEFQPRTGSTACIACGSSSSSDGGATTCSCLGKNRVFQPGSKTCLCAPQYEFVEDGVRISDEDSTKPCQPIVYSRCDDGNARLYTGECRDPDDASVCTAQCGSGGGRFLRSTGVCECSGVQIVEKTCDAACRAQEVRDAVSASNSTEIVVVNPGTNTTSTISWSGSFVYPPQLACTPQGEATSCTLRVVRARSTGAFDAVYNRPPAYLGDLVAGNASAGGAETAALWHGGRPEASVAAAAAAALAGGRMVQRSSPRGAKVTVGGEAALRAHAGAQLRARGSGATGAAQTTATAGTTLLTSVVERPIVCLELGSTLVWDVSASSNASELHYPVYDKDSLFNTVPSFDYSDFIALRQLMEGPSASRPLVFAHNFATAGTYAFRDAADATKIMLVSVQTAGTSCPDDIPIQPMTQQSLVAAGVSRTSDIIQTPDWVVIGSLIAAVVCLIAFSTGGNYYFNKQKWKPRRARPPVFRKEGRVDEFDAYATKGDTVMRYAKQPEPDAIEAEHFGADADDVEAAKRAAAATALAASPRSGGNAGADLLTADGLVRDDLFELENWYDLDGFNVRTLYEKLEGQQYRVSQELARQGAELKVFYDKVSNDTRQLKDMLATKLGIREGTAVRSVDARHFALSCQNEAGREIARRRELAGRCLFLLRKQRDLYGEDDRLVDKYEGAQRDVKRDIVAVLDEVTNLVAAQTMWSDDVNKQLKALVTRLDFKGTEAANLRERECERRGVWASLGGSVEFGAELADASGRRIDRRTLLESAGRVREIEGIVERDELSGLFLPVAGTKLILPDGRRVDAPAHACIHPVTGRVVPIWGNVGVEPLTGRVRFAVPSANEDLPEDLVQFVPMPLAETPPAATFLENLFSQLGGDSFATAGETMVDPHTGMDVPVLGATLDPITKRVRPVGGTMRDPFTRQLVPIRLGGFMEDAESGEIVPITGVSFDLGSGRVVPVGGLMKDARSGGRVPVLCGDTMLDAYAGRPSRVSGTVIDEDSGRIVPIAGGRCALADALQLEADERMVRVVQDVLRMTDTARRSMKNEPESAGEALEGLARTLRGKRDQLSRAMRNCDRYRDIARLARSKQTDRVQALEASMREVAANGGVRGSYADPLLDEDVPVLLGAPMYDAVSRTKVPIVNVAPEPEPGHVRPLGGAVEDPLSGKTVAIEVGGRMKDGVTGHIVPITGVAVDPITGAVLPVSTYVERTSAQLARLYPELQGVIASLLGLPGAARLTPGLLAKLSGAAGGAGGGGGAGVLPGMLGAVVRAGDSAAAASSQKAGGARPGDDDRPPESRVEIETRHQSEREELDSKVEEKIAHDLESLRLHYSMNKEKVLQEERDRRDAEVPEEGADEDRERILRDFERNAERIERVMDSERERQERALEEKLRAMKAKKLASLSKRQEIERRANDLRSERDRTVTDMRRKFESEKKQLEKEIERDNQREVQGKLGTWREENARKLQEEQRRMMQEIESHKMAASSKKLMLQENKHKVEQLEKELREQVAQREQELRAQLDASKHARLQQAERKFQGDVRRTVANQDRELKRLRKSLKEGDGIADAIDDLQLMAGAGDAAAGDDELGAVVAERENEVKHVHELNRQDLAQRHEREQESLVEQTEGELRDELLALADQISAKGVQEKERLKEQMREELGEDTTARTEKEKAEIMSRHTAEMEQLERKMDVERQRQEEAIKARIAAKRKQHIEQQRKIHENENRRLALEQKEEVSALRRSVQKEAEQKQLLATVQLAGTLRAAPEDLADAVKKILKRRHDEELRELASAHAAEKARKIAEAVSTLDREREAAERVRNERHAQEIADAGNDRKKVQALERRHAQEIEADDRKWSGRVATAEKDAAAAADRAHANARAELREAHMKEIAETSAQLAPQHELLREQGEAAADAARELEDFRKQLVEENRKRVQAIKDEKLRFEAEQRRQLEAALLEVDQELDAERDRDLAASGAKIDQRMEQMKRLQQQDLERRQQEELEDAPEHQRDEVLEEHRRELKNLEAVTASERERQRLLLEERLNKRRERRRQKRLAEMERSMMDELHKQEEEQQKLIEKENRRMAEELDSKSKQMSDAVSRMLTLKRVAAKWKSKANIVSEPTDPAAPLDSAAAGMSGASPAVGGGAGGTPGLSSSAVSGYLSSIHQMLRKLVAGVPAKTVFSFIDERDARWQTEGELQVLNLENMSGKKLEVYKKAQHLVDGVCRKVRAATVQLLIASELPHNDYARNAFRNSYFYDDSSRTLFVRKERLASVEELVLVCVHAIGHIKSGYMADDTDPGFLRAFFAGIRAVLGMLLEGGSLDASGVTVPGVSSSSSRRPRRQRSDGSGSDGSGSEGDDGVVIHRPGARPRRASENKRGKGVSSLLRGRGSKTVSTSADASGGDSIADAAAAPAGSSLSVPDRPSARRSLLDSDDSDSDEKEKGGLFGRRRRRKAAKKTVRQSELWKQRRIDETA